MLTKAKERVFVKENEDLTVVVGDVAVKIVFGCALAIGVVSLASLIGGAVAVGGPIELFKAMFAALI